MEKSRPSVLILGSRFDLTCDYVVAALRELGCSYVRLNSEDFPELETSIDPVEGSLLVQRPDDLIYLSNEDLQSIYYRRPVFLRDYGHSNLGPFEKFQLYQWAAFIRNLMIFDSCTWINHPSATYYAEHKAVQLQHAHRVGFAVPKTIITNSEVLIPPEIISANKVAIKGLDTVLLRSENLETFGFTSIVDVKELYRNNLRAVPVTIQKPLLDKVDIRVTVIGEDVFGVAIFAGGEPIYGDWRQYKSEVEFSPISLPADIQERCISLLRNLGLIYGAIDLAFSADEYYFLEINPTGEWAWLVDDAHLPIDSRIARYLVSPGSA